MILQAHHYHDRTEAGQLLARQLAHFASRVDTLVLAVPRGGVPVAVEVAAYLNAPLDALVVQTLELAKPTQASIGAVAPGDVAVYDEHAIREAGVTPELVAEITAREAAAIERRQHLYRGFRPPPQISGRVVILVDEGISTTLAMHAAVISLHRQQPAWIVVAAPVGSPEACDELAQEVHEVVCPFRPDPFQSVGLWYDHFAPIEDDTVRVTLRRTCGLPRA